jgi:hypothetical protein
VYHVYTGLDQHNNLSDEASNKVVISMLDNMGVQGCSIRHLSFDWAKYKGTAAWNKQLAQRVFSKNHMNVKQTMSGGFKAATTALAVLSEKLAVVRSLIDFLTELLTC